MFQWCKKMVLVGFVIENKGEVFNYINRFNKVFKTVRASPFSKKPLFDSYANKIKLFNDRVVFMYSGNITAFSFIMYILRYALAILLMVSLVFSVTGFAPGINIIVQILLTAGIFILVTYYFTYSKYGFWRGHLRTFRKKKFDLKKNNKKLLSSQELMDCFLWDKKPLFKSEMVV